MLPLRQAANRVDYVAGNSVRTRWSGIHRYQQRGLRGHRAPSHRPSWWSVLWRHLVWPQQSAVWQHRWTLSTDDRRRRRRLCTVSRAQRTGFHHSHTSLTAPWSRRWSKMAAILFPLPVWNRSSNPTGVDASRLIWPRFVWTDLNRYHIKRCEMSKSMNDSFKCKSKWNSRPSIQGAPIKNNPLEKMLYFSHDSTYFRLSQTFRLSMRVFTQHILQILLK